MNFVEILLAVGIVLALPGVFLLMKFGLAPEQNLDLPIHSDPSNTYLMERRKKLARTAMALLILAFGFLMCYLMVRLR